jgi:hypothetical protein
MIDPGMLEPRVTDTNGDGDPVFTFVPWSDGHAIGFAVTRHERQITTDDGEDVLLPEATSYVCLNPSQDTWSDGDYHPDVFVYTGSEPDVSSMAPEHFYNIDFEEA